MARKHNSNTAQQYLNLIDQTKAKPDLEVCFAIGTIGAGKSERVVALFSNKSLNSLPNTLKIMDYKDKKDKDYLEAKNFSLMRKGSGRLNDQGIFVVRLARGGNAGFTTVEKKMKEYFREIGKKGAFPDMELQQDAGELTEEEINAFEMKAEENAKYFTGGNVDGPGQQAAAAESPAAGVTGDADSETESVVFTPPPSEAGDGVPEKNRMEDVEESDSEGEEEEGDDKPLSDELKQGIATASSTIAGHAISLSRQIGAGQKAELGPLTDKITAWLEDMLAGLSPEEREMRLHNLTSRLLLMLAYPENLRNLQYVDERPATGDGEDEPGREKVLVNGIDLDTVSTEDLTKEEVTQSLFKLAKTEAMKRQLPYPLNQASPDRIAGMVASGWPKADDDAAGKRKAVQRLVAVIQQMFLKDDQLIGLLGFKKTDTAQGDDLVTSLVESIKEVWEAHRNAAIKQKDEVKRRVNQIVKVEALGGTWRHVDDIFLQIDGEISDQLGAIIGQEGDARSKAIEAAADTVRTNLGYLDGNNIIDLLDNPPFDVGQGAVGETLREGLDGVSKGLDRIESLSVAAAA